MVKIVLHDRLPSQEGCRMKARYIIFHIASNSVTGRLRWGRNRTLCLKRKNSIAGRSGVISVLIDRATVGMRVRQLGDGQDGRGIQLVAAARAGMAVGEARGACRARARGRRPDDMRLAIIERGKRLRPENLMEVMR